MVSRPNTVSLIMGFFAVCLFMGIFIAFASISYKIVRKQNTDTAPSSCVSDTCFQKQWLNGECIITYVSPYCCTSLEQCLQCQPFGDDINYYMDTIYTDLITNSNCTGNVYLQDSITVNNGLITQCFNTYPNSPCESTFGRMTINGTMFVNYIEANNQSFVNINNFLVSNNITIFNTSSSTFNVSSIKTNNSVFVNTIRSCFGGSVDFNGMKLFTNGTLQVPKATIANINISSITELVVENSVNVQGILISGGTIQGFVGNQVSNVNLNPTSNNIGIGYTNFDIGTYGKTGINGSLQATNLVFYPNNCTDQENCQFDSLNSWSGYVNNISGLPGYSMLNLKFQRHGYTVFMRMQNVTSTYTSPTIITANLANSTGPVPLNLTTWISPYKTVNEQVNIYFPTLNLTTYGIVTIDSQGLIKIQIDPYYTLSTTTFYWYTMTLSWMLTN